MLEIVAECDCCRLGLVDNGEAYIVPMNFGFEDAGSALTLYFHYIFTAQPRGGSSI